VAIEIQSYLTDIEPDNICGDDLEYDAEFIALEQEVQGKEEQTMGDSVIEAEPPNWREVIKQSEKLLGRTRDLRIFVHYLRALTATQGILGLADGMCLLRSAAETHWDNIHPQLDPDDDNDPTERINVLMALCNFDVYLSNLYKFPLVDSIALGKFNLRDIQLANGHTVATASEEEKGLPQLAAIEGAFQNCPEEQLRESVKAIGDTLENLDQLEIFITEQVGINSAPTFSELRQVLKEINNILTEKSEKRGLNTSKESNNSLGVEEAAEQQQAVVDSSGKVFGPPSVNNNEDVINSLHLICEYYKNNEPSSPIPLLVERVSRLVGKSFMEVMQDLAPNGVEQIEFLSGTNNED